MFTLRKLFCEFQPRGYNIFITLIENAQQFASEADIGMLYQR